LPFAGEKPGEEKCHRVGQVHVIKNEQIRSAARCGTEIFEHCHEIGKPFVTYVRSTLGKKTRRSIELAQNASPGP
jgi:hypothetical protein